MPSARTRSGSVRPWKTSVTRMTQNERKMISLRPGKGAPEAVESGSARAAASDTTPRMPDHAMIATMLPSGVGIAGADSLANEARQVGCREDPENSGEHNCARSLPPHGAGGQTRSSARNPPTTAGSCSPIKIKMIPLRRKTTMRQNAEASRRVRAVIIKGERQPI